MLNEPLDSTLRWVLLAIIIPGCSAAMYHRIRAARAGDKLDRRQEGLVILIGLRVTAFALWAALIAWMIRPSLFGWASLDLAESVRWAGPPLVALTFVWIFWVMRSLGANLTDTVVTRACATLVTVGPYRWIRNPLYTGILILGPALTLVTDRWFFAPACLVTFAILAVRTRKEEENLIARFGDAYRDYMSRTGRFLPKLLS